ncbi:site-specific DNA-methyltransferase [Parafannyhessea umbonata]|uniref:site-specific DNA-methyltransferase n=1 Tax=Parafannyhessea umbonata TaxID=604330 RepID=UPI003AB6B0E8
MSKQRLELTWYNKDMAIIPTETGQYGYTWVQPSDPRYCETHTLVYDEYVQGVQTPKSDAYTYSERADLEPQNDNLLILGESGDVLEALTRVPELADKYNGKVKLVYIDPPFNTSQTFSSYEDNLEHSIWLTMMRDRLLHLKRLLSNDGSIWVHLDDVEVHRMRMLLDEVFGTSCFVTTIAWEKAQGARNDTDISSAQDLILVYKKSPSTDFKSVRNLLQRTASQIKRYQNPDNDPRGPWRQGDNGTAKSGSEEYRFPITLPSGRVVTPPPGNYWRFSKESFEAARQEGRIWFGAEGDSLPIIKRYLSEVQRGVVPRTWWPATEVGSNQEAKRDHLRKLFPNQEPFSTPKPERLLERIIHIATNPGDIVLDCFAGSGTTAAVAQKMGRRWVTCELLETTFNRYTKPRLEMVVLDQEPLGITRTKGERVASEDVELPENVTADDAANFTRVLNKLVKESSTLAASLEPEDDDEKQGKSKRRKRKDPPSKETFDEVVRLLKGAAKTTRTKEQINWRGGGGFQVAHLSPACFDYDTVLDRVMLTDAATGDTLKRSVAANLGFRLLDPDDETDDDTFAALCFHGRRGNAFLYVYEGAASMGLVDWLVSRIRPGETIVLAVTSVTDGIREHLRRSCKGSRVVVIPDDIFRYSKGGDE